MVLIFQLNSKNRGLLPTPEVFPHGKWSPESTALAFRGDQRRNKPMGVFTVKTCPFSWGEVDKGLGAGEIHLQQEPAIELDSIELNPIPIRLLSTIPSPSFGVR